MLPIWNVLCNRSRSIFLLKPLTLLQSLVLTEKKSYMIYRVVWVSMIAQVPRVVVDQMNQCGK